MELTIDGTAVARWGAAVGREGTAIVEAELGTAMERSVRAVQRGAMEVVPVDTGTLRRSLTAVATPRRGTVGTNVPYAYEVEFGRRPGQEPPPPGVLLPWMRRKGIPAEAEYPIRMAIGRRGTRAHRYLTGTFERLKPAIVAEFEAAMGRAVARLRGLA